MRFPVGGPQQRYAPRRRTKQRQHDRRVAGRGTSGLLDGRPGGAVPDGRGRRLRQRLHPVGRFPSRPGVQHAHPADRRAIHRVRHRPERRDGGRHHDAADRRARGRQPRGQHRDCRASAGGGVSEHHKVAGRIPRVARRELPRLHDERHRQVIDASNPGPAGSITAAYPRTTITSADFPISAAARSRTTPRPSTPPTRRSSGSSWSSTRRPARTRRATGSSTVSGLGSGSLAKVSAGPIWRVPSQTGETWSANPGVSSALVPSNGDLFVLMWAYRDKINGVPAHLYQLYSTTVNAWGSVNSSAPPGRIDIPTTYYSNFSAGYPMAGSRDRQLRLRLSSHGHVGVRDPDVLRLPERARGRLDERRRPGGRGAQQRRHRVPGRPGHDHPDRQPAGREPAARGIPGRRIRAGISTSISTRAARSRTPAPASPRASGTSTTTSLATQRTRPHW